MNICVVGVGVVVTLHWRTLFNFVRCQATSISNSARRMQEKKRRREEECIKSWCLAFTMTLWTPCLCVCVSSVASILRTVHTDEHSSLMVMYIPYFARSFRSDMRPSAVDDTIYNKRPKNAPHSHSLMLSTNTTTTNITNIERLSTLSLSCDKNCIHSFAPTYP